MIMRRRSRARLAIVANKHPKLKWRLIGHYIHGRRIRKFFDSHGEAETYLEEIERKRENLGTRALLVDQHLHVMAIECQDKLAAYGKTLINATEFYCRHLKAVERSSTVESLVCEFLESKRNDGHGNRYLRELRHRLKRFEKQFAKRIVATITTAECGDWLRRLGGVGTTRNNYRRILSVFFNHALTLGYCSDNPITKTQKAKTLDKPIEVFSPEEIQRLLDSASKEMRPYLAIGAFAGLRSAELTRLDWSEIHLDRNYIEVTANKAKTASRRLVTISANLKAWLQPLVQVSGPVAPVNLLAKIKVTREAAKMDRWKPNGLRHSFASYHLAKHQDAAALALQMGHTGTALLFRHYREVVAPEAAERYWAVMPKTDEELKKNAAVELKAAA